MYWSTVGSGAAPDKQILAYASVMPSAIGDAVARAIRVSQVHIEAGALITIDPPRMRVLPFP